LGELARLIEKWAVSMGPGVAKLLPSKELKNLTILDYWFQVPAQMIDFGASCREGSGGL